MQLFQFKPRHPIVRLAFSPDGRFLVTAQPHTSVCVRDRLDGTPAHTVKTFHIAGVEDVALDPTGRYLAVLANERVHLSDTKVAAVTYSPWSYVTYHAVGFTACGTIALLGARGRFGFAPLKLDPDIRTCWQGVEFYFFHAQASAFGFTSDGRFAVALRHYRNPVLIDLATHKIAAELAFPHRISYQMHPPPIVTTGFDRVAIGQGECVAVYDLTGFAPPAEKAKSRPVLQPVRVLEPPPDADEDRWFPPVAFTPDGKAVLTGWERKRVRMWDLESEGVRREWHWRLEDLRSLAVAPDGLTAAAGGRLGKVMVWDLDG
jgi:WD40 repeat protein